MPSATSGVIHLSNKVFIDHMCACDFKICAEPYLYSTIAGVCYATPAGMPARAGPEPGIYCAGCYMHAVPEHQVGI